jgi:hypothetical protein
MMKKEMTKKKKISRTKIRRKTTTMTNIMQNKLSTKVDAD